MLDRHLEAARNFIGPARRTGRVPRRRVNQALSGRARRLDSRVAQVLVHCAAGLNRSGVLVAAERMLSTPGETVLETVAHCRKQRGNMIVCNESFQAQLVALARTHDRLGPAPGEEGSVVPEPAPAPPEASRVNGRPARAALDRLELV